jgi:hypothetical protein
MRLSARGSSKREGLFVLPYIASATKVSPRPSSNRFASAFLAQSQERNVNEWVAQVFESWATHRALSRSVSLPFVISTGATGVKRSLCRHFECEDLMVAQPPQELFEQSPRGAISTVQQLKSSPVASPPHGDPCQSPEEGLQEQLRRLQQCVRELLIKNQQLRMLLESANESPGQGSSPVNAFGTCEEINHRRGLS